MTAATADAPRLKKAASPDQSGARRLRADVAVLRVPLLPLEAFHTWGEGLSGPAAGSADDGALAEALEADRSTLRRRLLDLLGDEQIRSAIELAAPEIEVGLKRWRSDPTSKAGRSTERSLVRYITRMATRPSPFGIASGYLLGDVDVDAGAGHLRIGDRADLTLTARIDPGLLEQAVRGAAGAAREHPDLLLRRNPLLYQVGPRLRVTATGQRRNHPRLIAMQATPKIQAALAAAETAATRARIVSAVQAQGASADEAHELVGRLQRSDLLIPARQVTVTGPDPATQAVAALRDTPGAEHLAEIIAATEQDVRAGARPPGALAPLVKARLAELPTEVSLRRSVQVDAIRAGEATLPANVVEEIRRAIGLLARIAPRPVDPLATFRQRFETRFETRSVPLLHALDPDFGIRLETVPAAPSAEDRLRDGRRRARLLNLIERGLAGGAGTVELTDADIADLGGGEQANVPPSCSVMCSLAAGDGPDERAGRFSIVAPIVSLNGVRLLGRFCHGDDALTERVRAHVAAEAEAEPDVVFAEVATAPDTDWGMNVTHRPVLREWEIECGGLSGAPAERRIDLSDLEVSVQGGRVVLHSRRLGRAVRPRSTTALNSSWLALPAARFLAMVAEQEAAPLAWTWGELNDASSLPRVTCGRVVLSLRRWTVLAQELADVRPGTDAAGFRRLQAWRERRGIPQVVTAEHDENPVVVDFGNVLSVDAFLATIRNQELVRLVETMAPADSAAAGADGHYAHELLVAFTAPSRAAGPAPAPRAPRQPVPEARRRFEPGSEWLFAKLYGPASAADRLLTERLAELRDSLRREGLIDRWYFIRYADPDRHLRVRFHGDPSDLLREVLPALRAALAPALESGDLYRISIDTYEREVERYGGLAGVELMEAIAEVDSDTALQILRARLTPVQRRHVTAASVAALYADSSLDVGGRLDCSARLRTTWSRGFSQPLGTLLGADERKERGRLDEILAALDELEPPAPVAAIQARSARTGPLLSELANLSQAGRLEQPYPDVICSLAHLFVNRVLRNGGGRDELRVHDALARRYESDLARERRAQTSSHHTNHHHQPKRGQ